MTPYFSITLITQLIQLPEDHCYNQVLKIILPNQDGNSHIESGGHEFSHSDSSQE